MKYTHYSGIRANRYFWRTQQQQEIDYIEERDGKLYAFEFKWKSKTAPKPPLTFAKAYPDHEFRVITPENLDSFIDISDVS